MSGPWITSKGLEVVLLERNVVRFPVLCLDLFSIVTVVRDLDYIQGATSSKVVVPDGKAKMTAHFLGYEESGKHCNDLILQTVCVATGFHWYSNCSSSLSSQQTTNHHLTTHF